MPTYALLGATGATGSAIVRCLLDEAPEKLALRLLVRSKEKLSQKFPGLEQSAPFAITVVEGQANDQEAIGRCIEGADIIFNCIGTNFVQPGQTIVSDSAVSIIESLRACRKGKDTEGYTRPAVLLLRTCSLNDHLSRNKYWITIKVARWGLHNSYDDLQKAHDLLAAAAAEDPELLQNITVDPPTIHDQDGTVRTGFKLSVDEPPTDSLNYADLGAAFCELARRQDEFVGQAVGVSATGKVNENWPEVLGYLLGSIKRNLVG